MTRGKFLFGAVVASLAVSAAPALAQRSAGSGESTGGGAVSRGGGDSGGGAVSRTSGDSGSSSSGSVSSTSGRVSSSAPSPSSTREYVTAPSRPSERAQGRQRGDGDSRQPSGDRAVPRGTSDRSSGGTTTRSAGAGSGTTPSRRAVPEYSRPRDGRPVQGTAVERQFPRVDNDGRGFRYYPGYLGRSYIPGYGFGLGYYYDPYWYDPFFYGGGGYYGGGYGYPYAGGYGGYGGGSYDRVGTGSLRLKIKPSDAQVYVDGYFVGTVDEFDGIFQKLRIDAGGHRIEIRAEGHESIEFDVLITPGETVTYKGELNRIQ